MGAWGSESIFEQDLRCWGCQSSLLWRCGWCVMLPALPCPGKAFHCYLHTAVDFGTSELTCSLLSEVANTFLEEVRVRAREEASRELKLPSKETGLSMLPATQLLIARPLDLSGRRLTSASEKSHGRHLPMPRVRKAGEAKLRGLSGWMAERELRRGCQISQAIKPRATMSGTQCLSPPLR